MIALRQPTSTLKDARIHSRSCVSRRLTSRSSGLRCHVTSSDDIAVTSASVSRRACVVGLTGVLLLSAGPSRAEEQIEVVADEPGSWQHAVRQGDLVLIHYTGSLEDGSVFDSTCGDGLKYRDGGAGVFRPVVVRLSGYPQPGICVGLQEGLLGMKIGGRRTVKVPPALGFGDKLALAPYGIVPSGSTVTYEIELLRVSSVGPDLLVKGISRCGAGGAGAAADGCRDIQPAEFF